ncbi:mRNA cap guanine-N7 methyltransferase [Cucumispora dikerogammari]|nr:mRNA cap guanine-N7 methyltransferase [Cucumispora dikerogammari]
MPIESSSSQEKGSRSQKRIKMIQLHYNDQKKLTTRQERAAKPTINILNFNNFIKTLLIKQFSESTVLDIACGKGGDLFKYLKNGYRYYVGLDFSEASIKEALRRSEVIKRNEQIRVCESMRKDKEVHTNTLKVSENNNKSSNDSMTSERLKTKTWDKINGEVCINEQTKSLGDVKLSKPVRSDHDAEPVYKNNKQIDRLRKSDDNSKIKKHEESTFDMRFEVQDCFNTSFNLNQKFEVVSVQFSLHYAFINTVTVNTALSNICLHSSKYVMLTIPDPSRILQRRSVQGNKFGNKYYSIEFRQNEKQEKDERKSFDCQCANEYIKDEEKTYGKSYDFTLIGSVEKCVEFLINEKILIKKMKSHKFELVKNENFIEFFNANRRENDELYRRLIKKTLNEDELYVVRLYKIMIFKKINI